MNNSISLENTETLNEQPIDKSPWMRAREAELVKIIEAIGSLSASKEWSTLKNSVFDGVLENLEKRMASESNKMPLNEQEIYKLQGQIAWARKYSKMDTLIEAFRLELTNLRKQLNPPTERETAPDTI